jgi:uncharacterized protein YegL
MNSRTSSSKASPPLSFANNPAPRCPVVLVLDTSASMDGDPIRQLNDGVGHFIGQIQKDEIANFSVELACITFGSVPEVILPFTNVSEIQAAPRLAASGNTAMGAAITLGLQLLEERKAMFKRTGIPYYQPWMVLMTDGSPTDSVQEATRRVLLLSGDRKLAFFGIGVGDSVNIGILNGICPPNRPPRLLKGLDFRGFFEWLSRSVSTVSRSAPGQQVNLPPTKGWESV